MAKFSEIQIQFINDLLFKTSQRDVSFSELDYMEYHKIFPLLTKNPYHLFNSDGDKIWLAQLGNEIINDFNCNFKNYLDIEKEKSNLDNQTKKLTTKNIKWTSIRGWIAIGISILALILTLLTYIG